MTATTGTTRSEPTKQEISSSDVYTREISSDTSSHQEEEEEYPGPLRLALILFALCLAVFLVALDQTIISTAVPRITDDFKALDDVGWYGSAYMLTLCAFQLVYGKLYTYISLKWIFIMAVSIFEVGSLMCAVAPSSKFLIIGRAVAGLGCSGIFSGGLVIVARSVPLRKRPIYTGLISGAYGIASVVGPLVGGIFTDSRLTWRWCFWINLPVGAITLVVIALFFKPPKGKEQNLSAKEIIAKFDLLGTAFFVPAVSVLLLALQWGGSKYSWSDKRIIILLVLFGVLGLIFTFIQYRKGDNATLPFRIMAKRSVWASTFFAVCLGGAFFMVCYWLPIWFQAVQGLSATQAGIRSIPVMIGVVIGAGSAGAVVTIWGYYTPFMIASSIVTAIGSAFLTQLKVHATKGQWIGYQAITGIGLGFGMQQPLMAVQTVLSMDDIPIGTAAVIFFQSLGGAVFIAVAQNIMQQDLISGLTQAIPNFEPSMMAGAGVTDIRRLTPPMFLQAVILAYNHALTKTYLIPMSLAIISIVGAVFTEFKSVKGKQVVSLG